MRSLKSGGALFAAALCALLTTAAEASTLLYRDVPALARTSDAVVRGKVVRAESRWTEDRRRIVTDVEIAVDETLKGGERKTVVVRQPGGRVGDIGQKVSGLASFAVGEEVVVFLERRPDDSFIVNGMAQGKFRVERTSDGKTAFAVPDPALSEAMLIDPLTQQPTHADRETVPLERLRTDVLRAVQAPAPEVAPQKRPRPVGGGAPQGVEGR